EALVERDRDGGEAPITELLVQCLPDRQVLAAASPRGPGDEQGLLPALVAQCVQPAAEIGEREVRRLRRGEAVRTVRRRRPQDGDAFVCLHGERAIEQPRERAQVDAVLVDERRPVTHRHARAGPAEALGLQLPTEPLLERARGKANRVAVDGGLDRHGPAGVDEGQGAVRHGPSKAQYARGRKVPRVGRRLTSRGLNSPAQLREALLRIVLARASGGTPSSSRSIWCSSTA